ncbi:MAG: hypothetical protein JWM87_3155 [Candidatus Eremiobacteraeota bacterium]|nr:hypothetical protein [Candidatus Eremiobacteraeota bacterium]
MPRWQRVVAALVVYLIFGLALPIGVLLWLIANYETAFVLDQSALATPQAAFAPGASIQRVQGALGAGGGATAVYPDTSTVTIVRGVSSPEAALDAYAAQLGPATSTSTTLGSYTQRDMQLANGRVARAFGFGKTILAFVAPNRDALDALIARTPALQRNTRHGIGNVVLDDHRVSAILIFVGWFTVWTIGAAIVLIRLALRPVSPAAGTPAVEPEELSRRLLALADGTHPFTVTASGKPGEYFVDWRYDGGWDMAFTRQRMRKLVRIRLRLDPATRTVDSTDFESEFDASSHTLPDPFASVQWHVSRGYTFVDKEFALTGAGSYRFDIADMRRPVVATITGAGWTYRPGM